MYEADVGGGIEIDRMAMDQDQLQFWFRASVVINGGTLAAVMVYGFKIVRFFNRVEFQLGMLWRDYLRRTDQSEVDDDGNS